MAESSFDPQVTQSIVNRHGVIVSRGICRDRSCGSRECKGASQRQRNPGECGTLATDAIQAWFFAQRLHRRFLFRLFDAPSPGRMYMSGDYATAAASQKFQAGCL
jgi:hypothetical protein